MGYFLSYSDIELLRQESPYLVINPKPLKKSHMLFLLLTCVLFVVGLLKLAPQSRYMTLSIDV